MNILIRKQEKKIIDLYKEGLSVRAISKKLSLKKNHIAEVLKANNISKRENSEEVISSDVCMAKGDDVGQCVNIIEENTQVTYINDNFDILVEMIERYKANNLKTPILNNKQDIIIELPVEKRKDFKTSIRVNDIVWEQFKEFCKKNRNYTQKDIVSMALVEYMKNYS